MSDSWTEADLAAAWDAAVSTSTPRRAQGIKPAKACKVALKTERDRDASPKSVTASEPTHS